MKRIEIYIKKYLIITGIILSITTVSCRKILFNETEITREIRINNFHAVTFKGIFDIELVQDSANKVVLKGSNHISSVDAFVRKDTLIIDQNRRFSLNTNRNSVELHFTDLKYILALDPMSLTNKDTIRVDGLAIETLGEIAETRLTVKCNYLSVATSANTLGFQHFNGRAENCILFCRYGSSIFADSLKCRSAEIINDSAGDVRINVSASLKAHLWGNGNIYYSGFPKVEILSRRGSGNVYQAN